MKDLKIYVDGACSGNPGPGGWSFIILENDEQKIVKSGAVLNTTNNQCEMWAAINAMQEIENLNYEESCLISIFSDSAYLVNGFVCDWIVNWQKNGWLNSMRQPVANKELWEELIRLQKKLRATFTQIRRMSNEYAKKVDRMAKKPLVHLPT